MSFTLAMAVELGRSARAGGRRSLRATARLLAHYACSALRAVRCAVNAAHVSVRGPVAKPLAAAPDEMEETFGPMRQQGLAAPRLARGARRHVRVAAGAVIGIAGGYAPE